MANRLPGVTSEILDGGLGAVAGQARGLWAAVGAASLQPGAHEVDGQQVSAIQVVGTPREVRTALGRGDLAEVVSSALAIAEGTCYAVSVAGTRTAATLTAAAGNTGDGVLTIGHPAGAAGANAEYSGTVEITKAGLSGTAEFRITLDGVVDQVRVTPAAEGTYAIPDTDIVLTFDDAAASPAGFALGDKWTIAAAAPKATNAQVLAAIEELHCSAYEFEWISVAGDSVAALWAALASKATQLATALDPRYIHFKVQARGPASGESAADWQTALAGTERGNTEHLRLQIHSGRGVETDPWGVVEPRGVLGRASGISALRRPHETVDAVARGAIPGMDSIVPEGLTDAQTLALDQAGYATVRMYRGLRGVYLTHGRMAAPAGSDFRFEERRRVMDRASRLVSTTQRNRYTNLEFDVDPDGLDMFVRVSSGPLQLMQDLGEITSFELSIANTVAEILATDTIRTRIRIQPLGKAAQIENEISYYRGPVETGTPEEAEEE